MGKIVRIKDQNNVDVFPLTHERGVRDSSGVTLETKLAQLVGSADIDIIEELTQTEYDALATKDARTMYIISDSTIASDHVGVASLVQTTTSTEDGGTNVWTCTLTNGQSFTLEVKNGNQGDPGSSVDYPFTLANNLTETDSTKALAAPQGKVLDDKITSNKLITDADMDLLELKVFPKANTVALVPGSSYENILSIDLKSGDVVNVRLDGSVQTNRAIIRTYKNNTMVQDFGTLYVGSNIDITLTGDADQVRALNYLTTRLTADSITLVVGVPGYRLPTMADLKKVDDKFVAVDESLSLKSDKTLSSNIYNRATTSLHSFLTAHGTISATENDFDVSDYIRVYGKDIISNARADNDLAPMYNVYGIDKNYLRTISGNRQYTYQPGDYYVRICFATWMQGHANYGTTLESWTQYDEHYWLLERLNTLYVKPALSLVEDDFSYGDADNVARRTAFHDALVAAGMRCDFATSYDSIMVNPESVATAALALAKTWETEGFQLVMHARHGYWYNDPNGLFTKDPVIARQRLVPDIINTRANFCGRQRVFIYPGSSGDDPDMRAIAKDYYDAGISWNNGVNYAMPTYGDSRFQIKRFNIQLGEHGQLTKTQVKAGIDEAFANNAWVVMGMHAHWLDLVNTQSDENTFNVTNLMEILNYAVTKFGSIRHIEEVWEERKPIYDYLGI